MSLTATIGSASALTQHRFLQQLNRPQQPPGKDPIQPVIEENNDGKGGGKSVHKLDVLV